MVKWLSALLLLVSCSVSQAALQTNFAASYGAYLACASIQGSSKCFKLYFDPAGIVAGQTTAFVDVPDPGVTRLDTLPTIEDVSSLYTATLGETTRSTLLGRQRTESKVLFNAKDPASPPQDKLVIFTYDIGDQLALGPAGVTAGFLFQPGVNGGPDDYIDTYDPQTMEFRHYDFTALQGVTFTTFQTPEPGACTLAVAALAAVGGWMRKRRG